MSKSSDFNAIKYALPILGKTESGIDIMTPGGNINEEKMIQATPSYSQHAGISDGLANHAEAVLSFQHAPSGRDVFFKAFIDTFTETYASNFNEETVFGRTDPIVTYKNTTRRITLSWKIPAETVSEAYENLQKVQSLAQYLYPGYESLSGDPNALTLSQTPLLRLKVMNLLQKIQSGKRDPVADAEQGNNIDMNQLLSYRSTKESGQGLLGVITSMSVDHNLGNMDVGVIQSNTNTVLPKMIYVSIDFMAIHEETIGWDSEGTPLADTFPYNIRPLEEIKPDDYHKYGMGSINKYMAMEDARRLREQREQECANMQATMEKNARDAGLRYGGMFGKKRYNKDLKTVNRLSQRQQDGKKMSKRKQAKLSALKDITSGQMTDIQGTMEANGCLDTPPEHPVPGIVPEHQYSIDDLVSMDF